MKAKIIIFFIALVIIFCGYWLLSHSYVIVTFWLGMKAVGIFVAAVLLSFWLGRITKPNPKKSISDTYPPSSTEPIKDPDANYTKSGMSFFDPFK